MEPTVIHATAFKLYNFGVQHNTKYIVQFVL
jgi:hypothetical protein